MSSRICQMSWKTSYRFTGSTVWADKSTFVGTIKPRTYPTSIDEGTTGVIITGMSALCNFKSRPLDSPRNSIWWLISKPYMHIEIVNGVQIYRGHNSPNRPIPILLYGQQVTMLEQSQFGVMYTCPRRRQ